jgi:outer membrane lipoprotein-sorting protein
MDMIIRKVIQVVIFVIFLTLDLSAQANQFKDMKDIEGFKKKFEAVSKTIVTIQSSFSQEKNLSVISEVVKSKGKFYFKKENLLRWQYDKPYSYVIVFNGDNILIKDSKKSKVLNTQSNDMFRKIAEIMSMSLQGNVLNSKEFKITFLENDTQFLLKLFPQNKNMAAFLKTINMYISKKDYSVMKLELAEPSGDYTKIEFIDRKVNESISDEKFSIK